VVVRVKLELKILSKKKTEGSHLLTLNLKNRGTSILKNLVVRLHSADRRFSSDFTGCFVYALMPDADERVKFPIPGSPQALAYFSVSGYLSGDAYFSMKSPTMNIQARKSMENSILLT